MKSASSYIQVISSLSEWDGLRGEWDQLFATSPAASPSLRFDWLREWWRMYGCAYGERGQGLMVVTIWQNGQLVGALPLYASIINRFSGIRRVGFLSSGEREVEETCADYLDLLYAPGQASACIDALMPFLQERMQASWHQLEFVNVSNQSPLIDVWEHVVPHDGIITVKHGVCFRANLHGGFDAYLKTLSPKTRQHVRQDMRACESLNARFEVAQSSEEASQFLDQLIALHKERWNSIGKSGCFTSSRFIDFHRSICEKWVPRRLAVIARLVVDGAPIAVLYGFVVGTKFDYYQSGIVGAQIGRLRSPGTGALMYLMRYLGESGVTLFDFLRGASEYKQKLANEEATLVDFRGVRPSSRWILQRAASLGARIVRNVV